MVKYIRADGIKNILKYRGVTVYETYEYFFSPVVGRDMQSKTYAGIKQQIDEYLDEM